MTMTEDDKDTAATCVVVVVITSQLRGKLNGDDGG